MKIVLEIISLRKKTFICILLLLLADAISYAYISTLQKGELEGLRDRMAEMGRRHAAGPDNRGDVYARGLRDLATFRSRIPTKKEFTRVVGELFETAANNGLHVGNVEYKPELAKGGGFLVYTLSFGVSGSYAAVKSFISDVQRSEGMLLIDHLVLNNQAAVEEAVNMKIVISAFFRTEGR